MLLGRLLKIFINFNERETIFDDHAKSVHVFTRAKKPQEKICPIKIEVENEVGNFQEKRRTWTQKIY